MGCYIIRWCLQGSILSSLMLLAYFNDFEEQGAMCYYLLVTKHSSQLFIVRMHLLLISHELNLIYRWRHIWQNFSLSNLKKESSNESLSNFYGASVMSAIRQKCICNILDSKLSLC